MAESNALLVSDCKRKTLEWAASLGDEHPSERVEFAKALTSTFTWDEIRRLRSFLKNRKRKLQNDDTKERSKKTKNIDQGSAKLAAAVLSSDTAVSARKPKPWWERYRKEEIFAFDTEQLTKVDQSGKNKQHVGTIDVVGTDLKLVYGTKVYHAPDSIKDTKIWRELTGFNRRSFSDPAFPTEDEVKKRIEELFDQKVIITCGGVNDYLALGMEIENYDHFDLQQHWWWESVDEFGNPQRHGHKLKSLAKYYLGVDAQTGCHSSLEDAIVTMQLFDVYKGIKMTDDPENADRRVNCSRPYNEIPVLKDPIREKFKKRY